MVDTALKEQLLQVEGQIKELCPARDDFDQFRMVAKFGGDEKKQLDKTYSLYKALLQTGYDPDFDDDIMIEGTLTYIVDSWEKDESDLDVLRMNDFWCEIKVNHQMLCNLKGERHSIINRSEDDN